MKTIGPALNRVWDYIGADVLEICDGECSRDEVIEFVLDAGRLETMGDADPKELDIFRAMTYEAQCAVAKQFFTFSIYGY